MYVFVFFTVLAGFLFIYRVINSPFGEVLKAIRENEPRAISLGYQTDRYKRVAFALSATLVGGARYSGRSSVLPDRRHGDLSAQLGQWVLVIQGAIFVFCVLTFRRGIVGELARALRLKL